MKNTRHLSAKPPSRGEWCHADTFSHPGVVLERDANPVSNASPKRARASLARDATAREAANLKQDWQPLGVWLGSGFASLTPAPRPDRTHW